MAPTPAGSRWDAVRELFVSGDDPYAGADLPSSRNAVAVLLAVHGVLVLVFLPLFPPTKAVGSVTGWLLAAGVVAMNLVAAGWLVNERRQVWFDRMLLLAYVGIAQLLLLQYLSQTVHPYQLLMLVWVGAGAVQPAQRAVVLLMVLLGATLAPIATGTSEAETRDIVGRALLFATIGVVLVAYVSYVRTQRVRLRRREEDARAEATAATKRVRDLQSITDAALPHLGLKDLLNRLLDRIVSVFEADQGAILLRSGRGSRLKLGAARGLPIEADREVEVSLSDGLAGRIATSGRAVALEHIARSQRPEWQLLSANMESALGVPLIVDQRLVGVLYVGTHTVRRFTEGDATLLQLIGDRVALAVDRAHQFEHERHIAETLQRSLLPERVARIPGTSAAVRYLPAGKGMEVGGDWYDMLQLTDGRIVLAMGDVVGRGVRAAALMGKLRTSLEAYALDARSPREVVERLHSLMERQHRTEMATLVYVVLDADEKSAELASAGHLPPLLRTATREVRFLEGNSSPPLGALPYARFDETRVGFDAGCTLLLFTDGLVEQEGTSIDVRLEELRRIVEAGPNDPDALCQAVVREMLDDQEPDDDVALLAFQLAPLPEQGFVLELPAEPEVLSSVRTALGRWLTQARATREDIYAVQVACGEACANAIEHAYRPGDEAFRVEASRTEQEIVIAVRDFGEWRQIRGRNRGRGFPLMEALMDAVEVSRSSEGTTVQLRRRLAAA